MDIIYNLDTFFTDILSNLHCRPDTRAYIVGIYSQNISNRHDLSQHNISILFCQANLNNDFYMHQQIADWIFFIKTVLPTHFNTANDYYANIGRLSYYSCYKLINKQWPLYEELADQFILLERQVRKELNKISQQNKHTLLLR